MMQAKNEKDCKKVCERIQRLAADQELTNYELANKSGVSYRTVGSVMKNDTNLRDAMIGKFARALGTTYEYLATGDVTGGVIKEAEGFRYPIRRKKKSGSTPTNLHEAVTVIAEQLGVTETRVADYVAALMQDVFKERSTGEGKED